jgi:hypothetical protein
VSLSVSRPPPPLTLFTAHSSHFYHTLYYLQHLPKRNALDISLQDFLILLLLLFYTSLHLQYYPKRNALDRWSTGHSIVVVIIIILLLLLLHFCPYLPYLSKRTALDIWSTGHFVAHVLHYPRTHAHSFVPRPEAINIISLAHNTFTVLFATPITTDECLGHLLDRTQRRISSSCRHRVR